VRIPGSLTIWAVALTAVFAGETVNVGVSKSDVFVAEPFIVTYAYAADDALETRFVPPAMRHVAVLARARRNEADTTREIFALAALSPGQIVLDGAGVNTARRRFEKDAGDRWQSKVAWTRTRFKPVTMRVKALPDGAEAVGRFVLRSGLDRNVTHPDEPVTLTVTLAGTGNVDDIAEIAPKIPGVTVVPSEPQRRYRIVGENLEANLTQRFTLVAEKSFVVPPIVLRAFDPVSKKLSLLATQPLAVRVGQATPLRENDTKETPMNVSLFFIAGTAVIAAVAGFVLGFVAARYRRRNRRERYTPDSTQARFVALLRHIDDPEARRCAEAIEKELYEGAEPPDDTWIDGVIARLESKRQVQR